MQPRIHTQQRHHDRDKRREDIEENIDDADLEWRGVAAEEVGRRGGVVVACLDGVDEGADEGEGADGAGGEVEAEDAPGLAAPGFCCRDAGFDD